MYILIHLAEETIRWHQTLENGVIVRAMKYYWTICSV